VLPFISILAALLVHAGAPASHRLACGSSRQRATLTLLPVSLTDDDAIVVS
jgi:hypothetical protein